MELCSHEPITAKSQFLVDEAVLINVVVVGVIIELKTGSGLCKVVMIRVVSHINCLVRIIIIFSDDYRESIVNAMHREADSTTTLVPSSQQYTDNNLAVYTPASVSPMMSPSQLTPRTSHTHQEITAGSAPHSSPNVRDLHAADLHVHTAATELQSADIPTDVEVCVLYIAGRLHTNDDVLLNRTASNDDDNVIL